MLKPFRFAVVSDPHIALSHTVRDIPNRFHLVEVSIPALEQILQTLETLDIDFLLLPGDLTQHGERQNHEWLAARLERLPFPAYVVPGNHDIISRDGCDLTLSRQDFPAVYRGCGYSQESLYYCHEIFPGIHLLGLNSIAFNSAGEQLPFGYVDDAQLAWLAARVSELRGQQVMVMVHHNVLEHLPGQAQHPLGQRYILRNRQALIEILQSAGANLILTGHLHVQDVAREGGLWEITTGSLVSYPHPYRIVTVTPEETGALKMALETRKVTTLEDWSDLQGTSLQWMRDRSEPFMVKLLTSQPFNLPVEKAVQYAPVLKDFWARIANGDAQFSYSQLPEDVNRHLRLFGAVDDLGCYCPIDNNAALILQSSKQLLTA